MTNLTEKWKKGELPEWFYWIEFQDGKILPTTFSNQHGFICCDVICDEEKIKQILASMPSYEEYTNLMSRSIALDELDEMFTNEQEKNADLLKENTKLKELLHENRQKMFEAEKNYGFDDSIIEILTPQMEKIDEVLGEE